MIFNLPNAIIFYLYYSSNGGYETIELVIPKIETKILKLFPFFCIEISSMVELFYFSLENSQIDYT